MQRIDEKLRKIAKELDISEEQYENAIISYNAVGEYLSNNIEGQARIIPQGSFALGTVTKPITDTDDYDIDLVCEVNKIFSNPEDLKNCVGDVLKNSDRYSSMLKEEGKRCWTLKYSDQANYHMDILPANKNSEYYNSKKINITHKENGVYNFKTSNPEAYLQWFKDRQALERQKLLEERAKQIKCSVADVPEYKVKTTLQIAIQILKRYRDTKFQADLDNKPISIILTTVMALLYTGEESIFELIKKFSTNWIDCFEKDLDNNYILRNPANNTENFADKWITNPIRKLAFIQFVDGLNKDLVSNRVIMEGNFTEEADAYKILFGENLVKKVYASIGNESRVARESGNMHVNSSGTINYSNQGQQVKEHKFYGKD